MKESVSFSGNEVESTSLNFSELREKGIEYIQKLSGDVWTDYNSHDPGVTILEQVCYAITDAAFRSSLPIEDLLTPGKGLQINSKENAFFTPSAILSSHPVTIEDTRKMIIDRFEEIQNVWIITTENTGYEEQLNGINKVKILPKLSFLNLLKSDQGRKDIFLTGVNKFLSENRSLGENFDKAILLEPQPINIEFDIYIKEQVDVENTIAALFLRLLEFIYCPIIYSSFDEMKEAGYSMEEAFSGPRLTRGFIKNEMLNGRLESVHIEDLQKLFSKVKGISKCELKPFKINGIECKSINAESNKFFHLHLDENSRNIMENRFDGIYDGMTVFINNKKLSSLNKQKINYIFYESWSKIHRGYPIGKSLNEFFYSKLNGTFRNPAEYHSIQKHFPIIYGIGEEGISKNEPEERHAKALQLKTYLMFFEQHLANHLSQLGNINEFFNIDFINGEEKTYFTQWLNSIPDIEKLGNEDTSDIATYLESKDTFYDRKNRVYNHLLARFGEELNDIPWKVSLRLNLIQTEDEFQRILLQQKSEFLMRLKKLSYNRMKGESFIPEKSDDNNQEYKWKPSGLEEMISLKAGIAKRENESLIPDFTQLNSSLNNFKESPIKDKEELDNKYRHLRADEIRLSNNVKNEEDLPNAMFGKIGLKTLFRETLNYNNYRISQSDSTNDSVEVIFQKDSNKWVRLFECSSEENAIQDIGQTIAYFREKNLQSEGFYIVDHILLSDFLRGSKYGFSFLDEYGSPLFQTLKEESWCASEEERNINISKFYSLDNDDYSSSSDNKYWRLKDENESVLASYKINDQNQELSEVHKTRESLIHLFSTNEKTNGRLRLKELEKIRLMGTLNSATKHYRQRRLVFQRKLATGEIIDEDFFNLNISVLLPDWPARFQDHGFKTHLSDLFYERIPAHISNEILWINANELKEFEEKYLAWESLRLESKCSEIPAHRIDAAAFDVYKTIKGIKENRTW